MIPEKNHKQDIDIARIDERVKGVEKKVDSILNNHLPHLDAKIDKIIFGVILSILVTILVRVL